MSAKQRQIRDFYEECRRTMGTSNSIAQTEAYAVTNFDECEANRLMEAIGLPGRQYRPEAGDVLPRVESDRIRRRQARQSRRARADVMKSLGMTRTRTGGWE